MKGNCHCFRSVFWMFIAVLITATCAPIGLAGTDQPPVYNPPVTDSEILRREGGNIGNPGRSLTRGFIRGQAEHSVPSFTRGIIRGEDRSLFRSILRGQNRSLFRSLFRSDKRSLMRSLFRGEDRSLFRAIARGEDRSLFRGDNRSLFRSLFRGECRSLFRSLLKGENPDAMPVLSAGMSDTTGETNLDEEDRLITNALATYMEETGNSPFFDDEKPSTIPSILAPIAPLRTGYAATPQPVLYGYISNSWPGKIEFTLNRPDQIEPVFRTHIDAPTEEGIFSVDLADYNVSLEPGVAYEWFMAIVPLPDERSADLVGSAIVKYVPASKETIARLEKTERDDRYYVYAESGYWYDAISDLSKQIAENPVGNPFPAHRVALMDQVKLGKVADYDRKSL